MEAPEPPGAVENRLNRLLGTIVEGSVARLGFDAATVTARHDGNVATVLTSDQRYIALDDAQYETGEGPCLDALTRLEPIYLRDTDQARERWPHFAQTAQHLGVRSTLSLHLPVQEGRLAASMNLYATQTLDLDDDQIAAAASVGEPVAEALKVAEAYRVAVRLDAQPCRHRTGKGHAHGGTPRQRRRRVRPPHRAEPTHQPKAPRGRPGTRRTAKRPPRLPHRRAMTPPEPPHA
jgi:hypothetical protein